ncbi:hypothetical protein [Acinetobacter pittii]|uniref:hypothetical protein n=1 Tax=Acinetobacter pittii TaxID=48296 RepID=UPI00102F0688|nr:hypothetical protein [Acinetobacter pittii]RZG94375.1 hypothetical protein EXE03_15955 [Acinetobacter pittii]
MSELCFTDIYGKEHKIRVLYQTVSDIEVPQGFDHYKTIDQPFSVNGPQNINNIVDVFLNKATGELKTLLPIGVEKFRLIGNLNT